jgi:hypothetical protein
MGGVITWRIALHVQMVGVVAAVAAAVDFVVEVVEVVGVVFAADNEDDAVALTLLPEALDGSGIRSVSIPPINSATLGKPFRTSADANYM